MDKESFIISNFNNKFIGDDGAVINEWVYSKDIFIENTHFKKHWLSSYEIGRKAVMINISDAIVMNAEPKFILLGLMIPRNMSHSSLKELTSGIKDACEKYHIKVIGGDTISSDLLGVSVSVISYAKKPIYRDVKCGELLAYSGSLGGSLKSLKALQRGAKVGRNSRFRDVQLRDKFFYKNAKFINSAMDISDSLKSDIPKFIGKNSVKFSRKFKIFEFNSGEEYELLISFDKKNKKRLLNEAKKSRISLTIFGEVIKGRYKRHGKFEHF
ncbi:MAG: thiamine-phosphate kinase [Campylobacter sp.]|nr:thiamine-phosphate kinase [Campylobacter sp.]